MTTDPPSRMLSFRVSTAEERRLRRAAEREGLTLSALIRRRLCERLVSLPGEPQTMTFTVGASLEWDAAARCLVQRPTRLGGGSGW
jgi:hypothetical protein